MEMKKLIAVTTSIGSQVARFRNIGIAGLYIRTTRPKTTANSPL
jgi:hypothetical protein